MSMKKWQHLKIPFEDIEVATNNFKDCIGKGGYGYVYKGQLSVSGVITTVAVKRLNETLGQGFKEFLTEIDLLFGQHHPNVISLLGYCDDGKEKIIVYEYAERGSLDKYLRRSNRTRLTWLKRLKICIDAARGLDHLHNHAGVHQTIIHRDIKSANILLDEKWVAKISDLGLSKLSLAGLDRSAVITNACGTRGYCEPEYRETCIVKKESDVYSFGMVLFEAICGRLCNDDDGFLLSGKLAKEYYKSEKLDEIIDPSLKEQISSDSMRKFSKIAYKCLHNDREKRPGMDVVTEKLEKTLKIQEKYEFQKEMELKRNLVLESEFQKGYELPRDVIPRDVFDNMKDLSSFHHGIDFDHRISDDHFWKEEMPRLKLSGASTSMGTPMTDRDIVPKVPGGKGRRHVADIGKKASGVGMSSVFSSQPQGGRTPSLQQEMNDRMKKHEEHFAAARREARATHNQINQMMASLRDTQGLSELPSLIPSLSGHGNNDGDENEDWDW